MQILTLSLEILRLWFEVTRDEKDSKMQIALKASTIYFQFKTQVVVFSIVRTTEP